MKQGLHRFSTVSRIVATGLLLLVSPLVRANEKGARACSNATLKGTFGIYRTGTIEFGAGGLAAVGIVSLDGKGSGTVLQSISRNGDYNFDSDGTFTYELNEDCTGRALADGEEFSRMVVFDDGKGFYIFSESEGNAVYGVGTKIHSTD
jgi:hypothetical protein